MNTTQAFDPSIPDESRQIDLLLLAGFMVAGIVFTTFTRIITKLVFKIRLGTDDYLIVLAMALNLAADVCDIKATKAGFGRHTQYLTPEQQVQAHKWAEIAIMIATFTMWAVKSSICFFLLALIRRTHKLFRYSICFLLFLTSVFAIVTSILWGLQATPIQKLWDHSIPGKIEGPKQFVTVNYMLFSSSAVTDFFYALSPTYFLWNVKMDRRKKIILLSLIGCGLLVTVAAFLNIVYGYTFLDTSDTTWVLYNEFICDMITRNMSCIIANLPALWMLVNQVQNKRASGKSEKELGSERPTWNGEFGADFLRSRKSGLHTNDTSVITVKDLVKSPERTKGPLKLGFRRDPFDEFDDTNSLKDAPGGAGSVTDSQNSGIHVCTEVDVYTEYHGEPSQPSVDKLA